MTAVNNRKEAKPVSIRDVAHASGVSLTTVSLVLNQGDQRISQSTRERVLAAIDKLGYRPNRLAQGLQNRRSNILAILVPQLNHTFADVYFGELIGGIYDQASKSGYKILLEVATPSFVRQKKYLDLYDRCFIDGMLFMGSHEEHVFVSEMKGPRRPFMLVNNVMPLLDHVVCDYAAAGRLAAEHLVKLGHRRVALVHGAMTVQTARSVREAFTATLAAHQIALPDGQVELGHYTEEGGADAAERLIGRTPDLTAIFAGNDKMAIGAIQRLLSMGKRVPQDVSIIGCDDIHQAAFVTPALTTVRTPLYEVGAQCCKRMIEQLRGKTDACHEIIPVELVTRNSTAQAPLV